ncbi:MAG TPA: hypothetical protein VN923_08645, partial [Thermoanaerobaculia bacterium]|nr:hypothetical protein [Thermoanaerobaculia bacterium]
RDVPIGHYLDDDYLHLHEYGPAFAHLAPGGAQRHSLEEQLSLADAVWVTSPPIAESVAPYNPRLVPHNGAIPESWLPREVRPRGADGTIRIGCVGGVHRTTELQALWEGLRRLAEEMGDRLAFEFWGPDPAGMPPLGSPTTTLAYTHSFQAFARRLRRSRFDVMLSPLLPGPRPHLAKAPSAYYYTAVTGSLGIFSDVPPYAALPQGLTCLKAEGADPDSWYAALREAIDMPSARFDGMRRAAIEHVRLEYTERAEIHLHEAACRATFLHAATRSRRVDAGRPRLLAVFASGAASLGAHGALLRSAELAGLYGWSPFALCAHNAIELQRALNSYGIGWESVSPGYLSPSPAPGGEREIGGALARLGPALVVTDRELPAVAAACAQEGVPCARVRAQSVVAPAFTSGLRRVLAGAGAPSEEESPGRLAADTSSAADVSPRQPCVVVWGDLVPSHRQLEAIEVVAAVGRAGHQLSLELWGSTAIDPGYANRCRRRAFELGLGDRVRVMRPIDPCHPRLGEADVLLDLGGDDGEEIPEGVALALAGAVPVVTSSGGATAAGLEDGVTAILAAGSDVAAVVAALARALALPDEQRRRIVASAYRWARGVLHPQPAANRLLRTMGEALGVADAGALAVGTPLPSPPSAAAGAGPVLATEPRLRHRLRQAAKGLRLYRPISHAYWRTRRRRVLVVAEQDSISLDLYYRGVLPQLEAATRRSWLVRKVNEVRLEDLHSFAAVIAVRGTSAACLALLRAARRAGCRTLYDADDNLLLLHEVISDPKNPWRRTYDAARPEIAAMLAEVDLVKVYARCAVAEYESLA